MPEPSPEHHKKGGPSISRRVVLRTGTLGAAAVGAVSAFPGLIGGLAAAGPEASGLTNGLTEDAPEAQAVTEEALASPIVAHITDASTGQVALYVGEREVAVSDTQLVQRLLRAVR